MPELPEVESVRRSLEGAITGSLVRRVELRRPDICTGVSRDARASLLESSVIVRIDRRGKLLIIRSDSGRALGVHLGMTGRITIDVAEEVEARHSHAVWWLVGRGGRERPMVFNDARRFGGIECLADENAVAHRLSSLGQDALTLDEHSFSEALRLTQRTIKAALLDQSVIAGVGNIYADEALFAAGIRPTRRANLLSSGEVSRLADSIRATLTRAVEAGGSTIRSYAGADGSPGGYQKQHLVYGRGGEPCRICGTTLRALRLAQRATVFCPVCQCRADRRTNSR